MRTRHPPQGPNLRPFRTSVARHLRRLPRMVCWRQWKNGLRVASKPLFASTTRGASNDHGNVHQVATSTWSNLKQVIWTGGLGPEREYREINTVIANALNALISTH
ncbi:unnamed protein product [Rhizoctonia solani]|uniref:Uncharacterized protein n=1 Tax=Rhizoctonia solani TaxID=456999 RepID=A0A8H2WRD1_9AGAM|nr:unnamed protein product [Rhizoctonia solani]